MNDEDLIVLEGSGRRCAVCHSGRGWRRFEVVRVAGREPVVLCGSCRARFGDDPPVRRVSEVVRSEPVVSSEPVVAASGEARPEVGRDRLRAAVKELPSSFSTAMAAKAAGLNSAKTLDRLRELERVGEIRRVGKRWSSESPPSDIASAMDRLEARTSNLRIVRDRARVG